MRPALVALAAAILLPVAAGAVIAREAPRAREMALTVQVNADRLQALLVRLEASDGCILGDDDSADDDSAGDDDSAR